MTSNVEVPIVAPDLGCCESNILLKSSVDGVSPSSLRANGVSEANTLLEIASSRFAGLAMTSNVEVPIVAPDLGCCESNILLKSSVDGVSPSSLRANGVGEANTLLEIASSRFAGLAMTSNVEVPIVAPDLGCCESNILLKSS